MAGATSGQEQAQRRRQGQALWSALALAILMGLYWATPVFQPLERRVYDAAASSVAPQPLPEIAIIAIDDASLARLGPWPWPHQLHAQLLNQLTAAGAKTIVYTSVFHTPQTDPAVRAPLPQRWPTEDPASDALDLSADPLVTVAAEPQPESEPTPAPEPLPDPDALLAYSLQRAGNVLLAAAYVVRPAATGAATATAPPAQVAHKSALPDPGAEVVAAVPTQQPLDEFDHATAGVGHLALWADTDGTVRSLPLLLRHEGVGVPSLVLLAAAQSLHLAMDDVQRVPGPALRVGALTVPTDAAAVLRPHFYASRPSQPAFVQHSFHEVLDGQVDARTYQGKVVLIGATAAALQAPVAVPGGQQWAPVQVLAHSLSSIRQGHGYTLPAWGPQALWLALLLVAVYVVFGLPWLPGRTGAVITLVLLGIFMGLQAWLLVRAHMWQPLVLPMLALLVGQILHFLYGLRPTLSKPLASAGGCAEASPAEPPQDRVSKPAQTLVYDAVRDVNEHFHRADFPETVMGTAALSAPIVNPEPGAPVALSNTP